MADLDGGTLDVIAAGGPAGSTSTLAPWRAPGAPASARSGMCWGCARRCTGASSSSRERASSTTNRAPSSRSTLPAPSVPIIPTPTTCRAGSRPAAAPSLLGDCRHDEVADELVATNVACFSHFEGGNRQPGSDGGNVTISVASAAASMRSSVSAERSACYQQQGLQGANLFKQLVHALYGERLRKLLVHFAAHEATCAVITSLLAGEVCRLAMWHSVLRKVFSRAIPEAACPPASLAAPDQMKAVVARQILQRCPVKAWLPAPQAHLLGRPGLHRPVQGLCSFYRGIGGFAEGRGLN